MLHPLIASFENGILLAPLAGFTDSPYRRIARRYGARATYTELISAEGIIRRNKKTMELVDFTDAERPLGVQIFGYKPAVMAQAARIIEEYAPDLIDINMGCCAQKVCSGKSGAALLTDTPLLGTVAREVVAAVKIPVTAKIRIGWDSNSINYRDTLCRLEDAGIALVTVHGRTRAQNIPARQTGTLSAKLHLSQKFRLSETATSHRMMKP